MPERCAWPMNVQQGSLSLLRNVQLLEWKQEAMAANGKPSDPQNERRFNMFLRTKEGLGEGTTPLQAQRGRVLLPGQDSGFQTALE